MGFCRMCREKWSGLAVAHCTGCHQTFKSVAALESHRKASTCLDPAEIGMAADEKGFWASRMSEIEKIARWGGQNMPEFNLTVSVG
jgi:hypothetical protein